MPSLLPRWFKTVELLVKFVQVGNKLTQHLRRYLFLLFNIADRLSILLILVTLSSPSSRLPAWVTLYGFAPSLHVQINFPRVLRFLPPPKNMPGLVTLKLVLGVKECVGDWGSVMDWRSFQGVFPPHNQVNRIHCKPLQDQVVTKDKWWLNALNSLCTSNSVYIALSFWLFPYNSV